MFLSSRFALRPAPALNKRCISPMPGPHCRPVAPVQARKTVESVKAPGSESNFTGLPQNKDDIPQTTKASSKQMQEHIDLVRSDFQFVFKDIMDRDHFEDKLFFCDPISKFTFFRGYQFNVQFLRYFLAPIYELHEVRQAGEQEILVKWSWTMNFWWNRYNPIKFLWDPRLVFTGISILGYNPESGKWNKHVDAWDCLENQEFFSPEAFAFFLRQMFQVSLPPNRFTTEYCIVKKYKDWEIRRYKPYVSIEVSLEELAASPDAVGGGYGIKAEHERAQRTKAEDLLERYLALGNDRQEFFELTTPLFVRSDGVYSLVAPGYEDVEDFPKPYKDVVKLRKNPGGWYACGLFGGSPSEAEILHQVNKIKSRAQEEGSQVDEQQPWTFARYNKQGWRKGPFRRNEVLIPLQEESIDLWRGVDWEYVKRIIAHPV